MKQYHIKSVMKYFITKKCYQFLFHKEIKTPKLFLLAKKRIGDMAENIYWANLINHFREICTVGDNRWISDRN